MKQRRSWATLVICVILGASIIIGCAPTSVVKNNAETETSYFADPLIPNTGLLQVNRYDTMELVFNASVTPSNPFETYLLKLELTDPSGKKIVIDGFFDGDGKGGQNGNVWKARVTPYMAGTWTWKTLPGDMADNQLANLTGQFECVNSSNPGGIISSGKYFRFQNGGYVYLVGNFLDYANSNLRTTHTYMSETTSDSQRSILMTRQKDFHTVNKANIYIANKGDYSAQSVTPWLGTASGNDKTKMDLARWKKYDSYILDFKNAKILAELWFFADDSSFGNLPEADKNRLARYAMARTSAFSHTMYVIALEWQEGWTQDMVTKLGSYIQAHNPWGRVVSVHSMAKSSWSFSGQSWANFIASQAGNGASPSVVNDYARGFFNSQNIPHLSEEFGHLDYDGMPLMRAKLWANFAGGAAGSGTGGDLKALQRFIAQSKIPFQKMHPANELVAGGGSTRFALAETGHHYLVFSTSGSFTLNVTGSNLKGYWFDPRNPNANLGTAFSVSAGNQTFTPPSNTIQDWVLFVSDGSNLNDGVTHLSAGNAIISVDLSGASQPVSPTQPSTTMTPTVTQTQPVKTKAINQVTVVPTSNPTSTPRVRPTYAPTKQPTPVPTIEPTQKVHISPTVVPTARK